MIEAFTLKSRGKDMVCLLEYADPSVRGKKVILYKHGFFGNKITPTASWWLQATGSSSRDIPSAVLTVWGQGTARATAIIQPFTGRLKIQRWSFTGLKDS